jgi:hypothetical protein
VVKEVYASLRCVKDKRSRRAALSESRDDKAMTDLERHGRGIVEKLGRNRNQARRLPNVIGLCSHYPMV